MVTRAVAATLLVFALSAPAAAEVVRIDVQSRGDVAGERRGRIAPAPERAEHDRPRAQQTYSPGIAVS